VSTSLSALVPEMQPWARSLVDVATRARVGGRVTSTYRTLGQQTRLYDAYVAGNSQYPVARPGTSAHEFRMAFDYAAPSKSDQNDLGQVWESWGGVWGGRFGDPVHFEWPGFTAIAPKGAGTRCSSVEKGIAGAVDFVLGFAPYVGWTELVATLVSLGFPRSKVLKFLSNPVSSVACGFGS
jgi:D-alanyl-D-alanine carboxypeptidase